MTRNRALGLLLATVLLLSAVATPVAAEPMLNASPDDAGTMATHEAVADVGPSDDGNSLNGLNVDYQETTQNGDVKDVEKADITTIGIDRGGDGAGRPSTSTSPTTSATSASPTRANSWRSASAATTPSRTATRWSSSTRTHTIPRPASTRSSAR